MIEPMLCKATRIENAEDTLSDDWVLEHKYDGVRGVIANGKIYDRRQKEITHRFPEFENIPEDIILDGEIVAQSGEFNDISGRMHLKDKFKIRLSAKTKPAIFKVFDIVKDGELHERRDYLENMRVEGYLDSSWIELAPQYPLSELDNLWEEVLENGQEGLIAKRKSSKYRKGKRSADWLKIKAWQEAEAVFTEYEEHPKGITIETDDGRRVVVNGSQASKVAKKIDDEGSVLAEIQYLPQNDSDAWRFPSFRGVA